MTKVNQFDRSLYVVMVCAGVCGATAGTKNIAAKHLMVIKRMIHVSARVGTQVGTGLFGHKIISDFRCAARIIHK